MGMPIIAPSNTTRCQAVTDIIESVALEQTALSHILNAEGEKIQKIVNAECNTAADMLCINKSVQSMVESVTRLEMVLQSKLELFEDENCLANPNCECNKQCHCNTECNCNTECKCNCDC